MSTLPTNVNQDDNTFKSNTKEMQKLLTELNEITKYQPTKTQRKQLTPRERISYLVDNEKEILEIGELAGYKLYNEQSLANAGIITVIAKIQGIFCMIICNDYTVKGGTYYPITIKKHLRAQQIAAENLLPCVYLVDSGGAYLPMQSEVFPDREHFGRLFYNSARMSAAGIPQIAVVLGSCTAGGAYVPAMADICIMVKNQATIFLAGPPLVQAATGETVTAEELGGSELHGKLSGLTDYVANDEKHALDIAKTCIENTGSTANSIPNNIIQPKYPIAEIYGLVNADLRYSFEVKEIIARIVDGSEFDEFKEQYGKSIICGFAKIFGYRIGIIANNGVLLSDSSLKATHFIQLCDKRKIPLLFLQNITGFMVGKQYEAEGIAKHGAKLVNAVATTRVAKLTVVIGSSYGAGNYAMCGRAYDPRFLWYWPNAKTAVMGGEQAAQVLASLKTKNGQTQAAQEISNNTKEQYSKESEALYASARLWNDGIIDPAATRNVLGLSLQVIANKTTQTSDGFGIFRM